MKRVIGVMLLSTVLVSWQAEAKVVPSKLSGKLQSFRSQMRKTLESNEAILNAKSCAFGFFSVYAATQLLGISEDLLTYTLLPLTITSLLVFSEAVDANLIKQRDVAAKAIEEAYQTGENDGSYQVIKMLAESNPEHEPVEVNDRTNMLLKIFMWVQPPDVVDIPHIDALIDEKGGFPLTVLSQGVIFNNGDNVTYTNLFDDIIHYRREYPEVPQARHSGAKSGLMEKSTVLYTVANGNVVFHKTVTP